MDCAEVDVMLQGYLDGELNLSGNLEIEQHMKTCLLCSRTCREYRSLRSAVQSSGLCYEAPAALRKRIHSSIRRASRGNAHRFRPRWNWRILWIPAAAALALVVSLPYLLRQPAETLLAREVVAAHVRSLMPGHLTDVLSSDQHTVKPWFDGRLDFSPPVVDLASQGFPLVGGRLDYLDDRPVAALVYQRRKHLINLFVWPTKGANGSPEAGITQNGYHTIRWIQSGVSYWAVSDVSVGDLREFVAQLHKNL